MLNALMRKGFLVTFLWLPAAGAALCGFCREQYGRFPCCSYATKLLITIYSEASAQLRHY
jgi:hypothetical protein